MHSKNVGVCVYKRMLRLIALLNPPIWSVNTQSGLIIARRSQRQEVAEGNLYLKGLRLQSLGVRQGYPMTQWDGVRARDGLKR